MLVNNLRTEGDDVLKVFCRWVIWLMSHPFWLLVNVAFYILALWYNFQSYPGQEVPHGIWFTEEFAGWTPFCVSGLLGFGAFILLVTANEIRKCRNETLQMAQTLSLTNNAFLALVFGFKCGVGVFFTSMIGLATVLMWFGNCIDQDELTT